MNKLNSAELPINDQTKFRLNETNKLKDYFSSETQERQIISKKLSKHNAAFDYTDKALIVLSATSGEISIIYFTSVIEVPAGFANGSFTLIYFLTTGLIRKCIERNKKEK